MHRKTVVNPEGFNIISTPCRLTAAGRVAAVQVSDSRNHSEKPPQELDCHQEREQDHGSGPFGGPGK